MPGVERAPGTCAEPGCAGIPVAKGRCRAHLVWPKRNPDRADGRTVRNLRDRLARRDGYRCRHPDASERTCSAATSRSRSTTATAT
jgi:hypothetical protein